MPAENTAHMDLTGYEVKWKTLTVGLIKDVDPTGLKPKKKEKKIGKIGDIVIDRVSIGMDGSIKMTLHQVNKTVIQQLCPWWTSGSVALTPATKYHSEYANAGELRLHPLNSGATDEDIVLLKAFPIWGPPKGDGENWREITVEWNIYPDQTAALAGTVVYGYYGDPP
jgi:hypothetical protein